MKVKIKDVLIFNLGLFILLNLMLTNYLYEFNSGLVEGGFSLRFFLKIISLSLIILSSPKFNSQIINHNKYLIICYVFFLISILIYTPFSTFHDTQFLNIYLCLFILFGLGFNPKYYNSFNKVIILNFIIIWFPFDLFHLYNGTSLWENKAFIGGIGNPSSYGLIMIYILLINKNYFNIYLERLISVLAFFSLLMTQALMPILIFLLISIFTFKKINIIASSIVIFTIYYFYIDQVLGFIGLTDLHFLNKFYSLIYITGNFDNIYNLSASIYYRIDYFKEIFLLFDNVKTFLFGHVNNISYNAGDSQFVSYLTSFGFPLFFFFLFCIYSYHLKLKTLKSTKHITLNFFLISTLFILLTNRFLDYWPNAFIVFFILNYLIYSSKINILSK